MRLAEKRVPLGCQENQNRLGGGNYSNRPKRGLFNIGRDNNMKKGFLGGAGFYVHEKKVRMEK